MTKDAPPRDDAPREETDMPAWAVEDEDNRIWTDGGEGDADRPAPHTSSNSDDEDEVADVGDDRCQDDDSEEDSEDEDEDDDSDVADSDGPVVTVVIVDDDGNRVTVEDDTDVTDDSEEDSEDEEDDTDEDDTDEDDTDEDDTEPQDDDADADADADADGDSDREVPEGQSTFEVASTEPPADADADAESDKPLEVVETPVETEAEIRPEEDVVGTPEPISEDEAHKGRFCGLFKYSPRNLWKKIKYWFIGTEDKPLPLFSTRAKIIRWYRIHFCGYVYLRTLDYDSTRKEYVLHEDLIHRRDVPKSAVHCSNEKNTFLVSSFKVPYEPWKDNGFGAVNAYLYMKDLSLDEALLMSYQYPKINGKMLLVIGIIAMSVVFYIVFMMR